MGSGWIVGSDEDLSERRFRILWDLMLTLPNSVTELKSNDKTTADQFKKWTGFTQASLEKAWEGDGFIKGEKGWVRLSGKATTTSCEGLILEIFNRIEKYGFGKRKGGATAFNLANVDRQSGRERQAPVGWHWYRDAGPTDAPKPGDLYQIGALIGEKQWSLKHVGMVARWEPNGGNPLWETVEAGQGGPGSGYDMMKRKASRLVFPISAKDPKTTLMGWLNIDEHFG